MYNYYVLILLVKVLGTKLKSPKQYRQFLLFLVTHQNWLIRTSYRRHLACSSWLAPPVL